MSSTSVTGLTELKNYFSKEFSSHPNLSIAIRVLDCLLYIQANPELIRRAIENPNEASLYNFERDQQNKVLRAPNGLSFHVLSYNPSQADQAIADYGRLIDSLAAQKDFLMSPGSKAHASCFLSKIQDSEVGCLEARLAQAMLYLANPTLLKLSDLMGEFFSTLPRGEVDSLFWLNRVVSYFSALIGEPVQDDKGAMFPLTFAALKDYAINVLRYVTKQDWESVYFLMATQQDQTHKETQDRWTRYYFSDQAVAQAQLRRIQFLLDEVDPDIYRASVRLQRDLSYSFRLTKHQEEELTQILYSDRLVKTIRFDEFCFFEDFSKSITKTPRVSPLEEHPSETGISTGGVLETKSSEPMRETTEEPEALLPLRHLGKRPWTVNAAGVFFRPNKNKIHPHYPSDYLQKKPFYSKPQSTTLTSRGIQPKPFGFGNITAGASFALSDSMVSRYLSADSGTVSRPWDFKCRSAAQTYYNQTIEKRLFRELFTFKIFCEGRDTYNEVMARLSWNILSSCILIFNDTLQARAVGQIYAQVMRKRLQSRSSIQGKYFPLDYQVPIVFYLPKSPRHLTAYSLNEQKQDVELANKQFSNCFEKNIKAGNFSFLGIVSNAENVLLKKYGTKPVLIHLLEQGQYFLTRYCLNRISQRKDIMTYLKECSKDFSPPPRAISLKCEL